MNGIQLTLPPVLRRAADRTKTLAASRISRGAAELAAYGTAAFALSALPFFGGPLPLGACLAFCPGLWAPAGGALLGGCGGYVLLWGWEAAMEPLALSLSFFAAALIFRGTPVKRPALSAALTGAVEGLFLLDSGLALLPLLRLAAGIGLSALLPALYGRAADGAAGARLGAGALLLLGLASVHPPLGPAAALCGAFLLPELDARLPEEDRVRTRRKRPEALPPQRAAERALHTMYGVLAREDPLLPPIRLADLYDFAADKVCRCCVRAERCWEQGGEQTYRDLCTAGELLLHRGTALREDFPAAFLERCPHAGGFVTAVNQALDEALTSRRELRRRGECRRVAAGQYLALERLLAALSRPAERRSPAFAPELAVGSACRTGNRFSGDRGAACRDRFGNFYVLLCDGMGTGAEARAESDRISRLLTAFLESGLEADEVLELVNGFCLLRGTPACATVDLLKLSLGSGWGTLYKWGAAPSYLRRGAEVEKIGTVTPPPGLGTGEGHGPGQYELSLREGETLVMVSDGAFGEETARRLAAFTQGTVRDLASCLITLGEADGEDDRTAVVLRLRSLESA